MKMNKKAQWQLALIPIIPTILTIIGVAILCIVFLASTKFRWTLIGIAIFVGVVWILGKAVTSEKGINKKTITVVLILCAIGAFFILGSGLIQNTFSAQDVNTVISVIPCSVASDCNTYLLNNGVLQSNLDTITLTCVNNKCVGVLK